MKKNPQDMSGRCVELIKNKGGRYFGLRRLSFLVYFFFFIGFWWLMTSGVCLARSYDTLKIEKVKGKRFIVHLVAPQETLYAISRHYQVSVGTLYEYNDRLKGQGLKMYDTLFIPFEEKSGVLKSKVDTTTYHVVQPGETLFALSQRFGLSIDDVVRLNRMEQYALQVGDTIYLTDRPSGLKTPVLRDTTGLIIHIVRPHETLFGISRHYGVDMTEIARWNGLSDHDIGAHQRLIVGWRGAQHSSDSVVWSKSRADTSGVDDEVSSALLDTTYLAAKVRPFHRTVESKAGKTRILEEGFAMLIDGTGEIKKLLALHRSAALGSSVAVTNEMTHETLTVKVAGRLPENLENQKVLIRLSEEAFKKLGALDEKIPVIIQYDAP